MVLSYRCIWKPIRELCLMRISDLSLVLIAGLLLVSSSSAQQKTYTVDGVVKDLYTGRGMPAVNVFIQELQKGTITDSTGYYKLDHLKKGVYTVTFTRVGYKKQLRKINFERNERIALSVKLEEQSIVFEAIEITPGIVELSSEEGASSTVSNQEIISSSGVFSKDVYRTLQTVPGISSSEWSSKPHIKGGNPDETAVIIDNLEIYEPFHLEEIDGPYSVISSDLVKDMKVITGGFAPKYGDKMSGILKVNTIDRVDEDSIKASVDFSNAAASLNQRINDRTNVFFSGRRSYIYLLEKASGNNFPTVVYDIWSKLDYKIDAKNRLSLNVLFLDDRITYKQDSTFIRREFFKSSKINYYAWLNWYRFPSEDRYYSTTAGYQKLRKNSHFAFDGSFTRNNADDRTTTIVTLKQDHFWKLNASHSFEFGIEANQFFSDYLYREYRLNPTETNEYAVSTDIISVNTDFIGYTLAGYFQDNYKFSDKLNFMYGVRTTTQEYADGIQIAPRAGAGYAFSDKLSFKFAYGWYYQPDNFQKMKTYANQSELDPKPEKSIHYIANVTYLHGSNTVITVDAYYKDYPRLNDDYRFDFSNRIEGVGIVDKPYNTKSGYASGFDILIRRRYGNMNLLSIAYSLGWSVIRDHDNNETYRDLDRTHALSVNNILSLGRGTSLSALFRIHSGDPYTPSTVRILGDSSVLNSRVFYRTDLKNSKRLPVFHSLDMKIEKRWDLNQMWLVTYAGVINLYDHDNVRQKAWKRNVENGKIVSFTEEEQLYYPRFYTLGLSLEFSLPRSH